MAHLWERGSDGVWSANPLGGTGRVMRGGNAEAEILHSASAWLLAGAASGAVRVNGEALLTGARVLADRDEIRLGGQTFYFSTEALAAIESFPGAERTLYCPRCKQAIQEGSPAVLCPNPQCRCWHHQSGGLPCWTYAETCAMCSQPSALGAGFQWMPEDD